MGKAKVADKTKQMEIDNEIQNGPTRKRGLTDFLFCILMLGFWGLCIFIFYYGYTEGDPAKITQTYDVDGVPCGNEEAGTKDYPYAFFYQPLSAFGDAICVKSCPNW